MHQQENLEVGRGPEGGFQNQEANPHPPSPSSQGTVTAGLQCPWPCQAGQRKPAKPVALHSPCKTQMQTHHARLWLLEFVLEPQNGVAFVP